MGFDSTTDLLFRISGDSAPAQSELQAFRSAVKTNAAGIGTDFAAASAAIPTQFRAAMGQMATATTQMAMSSTSAAQSVGSAWQLSGTTIAGTYTPAVEAAAAKTVGSAGAARLAMRGLGQEIGVNMPRYVASWLTSLGPVAGIMTSAFSAVAVIGLLDIVRRIPGQIEKGILALQGWDDAAKKAFEDSRKSVLAAELALIDYHDKLREIQTIGLQGIPKLTAETKLNGQAIDEVVAKLVEYKSRMDELRAVANYKPQNATAADTAGFHGFGASPGTQLQQGQLDYTQKDIEKAKTEMDTLQPVIDQLLQKLQELSVNGMRIAKEAGADASDAAVRIGEEIEQRLLSQQEQTLAVRQRLWDIEIDGLKRQLSKEYGLRADQIADIEKLRAMGHASREQDDARRAQEEDQQRQRAADAALAATARLQAEIAQTGEKTRESERQAVDAHIAELTAQYAREGQLGKQNQALLDQLHAALLQKVQSEWNQRDAIETAGLQKELAGEAKTLEEKHRLFDEYIAGEFAKLDVRSEKYAQNLAILSQLEMAGHAKIDADAKAAFDSEMAALAEHRAKIEQTYATSEQRIAQQYDADVAKFSAAEEKKALAVVKGESERAAIRAAYAGIRTALYQKEQQDLQALRNSRGWQGVFGNEFAQAIRGNEALTRQWATSTNQSLLMVQVAMESLRYMGRQAFAELAQGMGQNIANAFIYEKSIGQAMRQAVASTLESIAAEAATWTIYATALGFLRLAQHDPAGAGAAFTSAAIWGSVAAVAAVTGRAIAPPQAGSSASAGGAAASTATAVVPGDSTAASAQQQGPLVHVYITNMYGGPAGIDQLASAINDAVLNRNVQLTATNTTTGQVVRR